MDGVRMDDDDDDRDKDQFWEVVCPDGLVRDYPYHNRGDADCVAEVRSTADKLKSTRCRGLLGNHRCPLGTHTIRPITFCCPDPDTAN